MTEIKICGITRIEDALCAAACGADAIGFIFHRPSPRFVHPDRAKEIVVALPREMITVGVFVNRSVDEVEETAEACGLDLIQLHGDETPEYCRRLDSARLIKAVSPRTPEDLRTLGAYNVRAFLLDARDGDLYGGTGKRADWTLAAQLRETHPLILAGGLSEENITDALGCVAPHAVDINSGCEREPGIKDHDRMRRIVAMIRQTDTLRQKGIFARGKRN